LDETIGESHLVRVINQVVNKMDISNLMSNYKGGGTSSYHPRMLLKVLLYAYCLKIYTGRKIANALGSDITFMWLSGKQYPDFRTINNFRSGRLKESIASIFKSLRIEETIEEIERLNREEDTYYGDNDLCIKGESDFGRAGRIEEKVKALNRIANPFKAKQQRLKQLEAELAVDRVRVKVYEENMVTCGTRSGYSTTDTDANPMRTKECSDDLRPSHNGMIGSEGQYITGVTIHQNSNDASYFKHHMEEVLPFNLKKSRW
jgi:hypothetical protein